MYGCRLSVPDDGYVGISPERLGKAALRFRERHLDI